MIEIKTSDAEAFLSTEALEKSQGEAKKALEMVRQKSGTGSEWLGWRDLLAEPNDALLEEIGSLAAAIRKDADILIVCGIGGSYLGARAVIEALEPISQKSPAVIYAGNNLSGAALERLIQKISAISSDKSHPSVYLNVISKSGTTIEPALSFRVLRRWMEDTYGADEAARRIICTTSVDGGALNQVIDAYGYKKFIIPDDVGGRFSVLTPVGLLPIAVAGVDIRALFYGAVTQYEEFEKNPEVLLTYAAMRKALYDSDYTLDIIATFEPELSSFGGWLQQLYGESEGKSNKGIYPAVHTYSTDLHSLGQMVQDGERNMFETFISVKSGFTKLTIPEDQDNYDGLNYVAGENYHEINQKALKGTRQAHIDGHVPVIDIELDHLDDEHIGRLIYLFELTTAVYVYTLDLNPFNQPGVEAYKKAMYKLLGKPGA